jgi:hypothetical protein
LLAFFFNYGESVIFLCATTEQLLVTVPAHPFGVR